MDPVINSAKHNKSIESDNTKNHCQNAPKSEDNKKIQIKREPFKVGESSPTPPRNLAIPCSQNVSVEEAIAHFKVLTLPRDINRFQPERSRITNLLSIIRPPPKLLQALNPEVELIHAITLCGLDWTDVIQFRMLQTIFKKLTDSRFDCMKRGIHWQQIGFQGNDPATDLRGVGLFGLLQFLFLTSDKMLPLGKNLYRVANSETQPFPLAVLSLNITNIVLNVFNSGKLNREINMKHSVLEVLNSFYAALLVYIFNTWVSQKKTIKDSGYLLKDAERYCSRNLRRVLKDLPQNLASYKP